MARTLITAFGRLSMHYSAYGNAHVARCYVREFLGDPAVGTFAAASTPASLDALATALTDVINPLYMLNANLTWGDWIGEEHTSGESFIPINNGTITDSGTAGQTNVNDQPKAVAQATWTFRDAGLKHIRFEQLGVFYVDAQVFRYGGLGGAFKDFADYILGSSVIVGRAGTGPQAMVSLTFDTNDGLTRRYRR